MRDCFYQSSPPAGTPPDGLQAIILTVVRTLSAPAPTHGKLIDYRRSFEVEQTELADPCRKSAVQIVGVAEAVPSAMTAGVSLIRPDQLETSGGSLFSLSCAALHGDLCAGCVHGRKSAPLLDALEDWPFKSNEGLH